MAEFEPVQTSKIVDDIAKHKPGDLVPGSNFAIVSTMAFGLESGKGPGRITICESRSRGNCLNCFRRHSCDAIDLKK